MTPTPAAPAAPQDLVAAPLITSAAGAELHLVTREGHRLRLATDEPTARRLARALWSALERRHSPEG